MITKSLKKTDVENAVGLEKVYIEHEQYKNELKALKAENRYLKARLSELTNKKSDSLKKEKY